MAEDIRSWLDKFMQFGDQLGLPNVDIVQLIEAHRKNLDVLERSAQTAAEGTKALAEKQREIVAVAFQEAANLVRDFKPGGDPKEILVKQAEFAKKVFNITIQNTRDVAELASKTTADATAILRERLQENLREFNAKPLSRDS